MVAAARAVVDRVNLVEQEFVTVTEIYKRAVMDIELNAGLRSDGAGDVTVVIHQTDERAEIRHDDVRDTEIVIDERRSGSLPKIALVIDKIVNKRLADTKLPAGRQIIAVN